MQSLPARNPSPEATVQRQHLRHWEANAKARAQRLQPQQLTMMRMRKAMASPTCQLCEVTRAMPPQQRLHFLRQHSGWQQRVQLNWQRCCHSAAPLKQVVQLQLPPLPHHHCCHHLCCHHHCCCRPLPATLRWPASA